MNHSTLFRRFDRATRYACRGTIHHDLKIKPMFAKIKNNL